MKQGIEFFPLDCDFFDDDKVGLVEAEHGVLGSLVALRLLCKIYKEGYYCQWSKDTCLLFARRMGNGATYDAVQAIVLSLVERGFFDKGVFEAYGVLTSRGIQTRYLEVVKRRKDVTVRGEYMLVDAGRYGVRVAGGDAAGRGEDAEMQRSMAAGNDADIGRGAERGNVRENEVCEHDVDICSENANISVENVDISKHSKVKESKGKEKPPIGGKKKSNEGVAFSSPPAPDGCVKFLGWMDDNAPWLRRHLVMPTADQLAAWKRRWRTEDVLAMIRRLENKKKFRGNYVNLYDTIEDWLEADVKRGKVARLPEGTAETPGTGRTDGGMSVALTSEEAELAAKRRYIELLRTDARRGVQEAVRRLEEMGEDV